MPTKMPWFFSVVPATCLVAVIVVAYSTSFDGPFVFDDLHVIEVGGNGGKFAHMPNPFQSLRATVYWTFWANYNLNGLDPVGYHIVNLAIHIGVALLLFAIVRRTLLLPKFGKAFLNRAHWLAFFVAIIWAVHPLQTQAITYITQRFEAVMTFFSLLCIYCLLRSWTSMRGYLWIIAASVAFAFAVCSKEVAIVLPVVLILFDRGFNSSSWKQAFDNWRAALPVVLIIGIVVGQRAFAALSASPWVGTGAKSHSAVAYLFSQPKSILLYLRLVFWPVGQSIDYQWPIVTDPTILVVTTGVVVALIALAVVLMAKKPAWGMPAISFFVILSVTSSILPIADLAVEHRMYMPSICVVVLAVFFVNAAISKLLSKVNFLGNVNRAKTSTLLSGLVALPLALILSLLTMARNDVYDSDIKLWGNVVAGNPQAQRGWQELGDAHVRAGNDKQAIDSYLRCVENAPESTDAYAALTLLYLKHPAIDPQREKAMANALRSMELTPERYQSNYALGSVYFTLGEHEKAVDHLAFSVMKRPWHFEDRYRYAQTLFELGRSEESIAELKELQSRHPERNEVQLLLDLAMKKAENES